MQTKNTTNVIKPNETDKLFAVLSSLHVNAEKFSASLPSYDDDQLSVIFHGLEETSKVAWMLQADVIAELKGRGRYGDNVMRGLAQFLKIDERRVYELAQIHDEILLKNPEVRELPLDKSHFINALRAKKHGKDPVEVLTDAADNLMGANQMRRKIEEKPRVTNSTYYEMTKSTPDCKRADLIQVQYFSPAARIVEYDGTRFLEVYNPKDK